VPPLRDRKEDIPILAKHFLNEFSAAYGKKTRELTDAAMENFVAASLAGKCSRASQPRRAHWFCLSASAHRAAPAAPEIFRGVAESPSSRTPRCTKRAAPMSVNLFAQAAGKSLEHDPDLPPRWS